MCDFFQSKRHYQDKKAIYPSPFHSPLFSVTIEQQEEYQNNKFMYQEEMKSSELAKFLSNFDYVFVDTCSLMEDSFPAFMDVLTRSKEYWKEGLRVVILGECIQELKRHTQNKKDSGVRIAARRALKIIRHDKWHRKTFEITKPLKKTSDFADNAIFTTVSGLRIENKILILTQDKTLTTDLLKLNRLDSQRGRYLEVYRLTPTGTLEKNPGANGSRPFVKKHEAMNQSNIAKDYHLAEKDSREAPKTPLFSDLEKQIKAEDARLSANLSNPTYPDKNKIQDIDAQLHRLSSISASRASELKLNFSEKELRAKRSALAKPSPVVTKPEEKKPETKVAIEPKKAPLPITKKETPAPHPWLAYGPTPAEALRKLADHYLSLIRDPAVSYFAAVHGPLDLTEEDCRAVDALGAKNASSFVYEKTNYRFSFRKEKDYSVSWDNDPAFVPQQAKAVEVVPKKEETPTKPSPSVPATIEKPAEKAEEKPKETKQKATVSKKTVARKKSLAKPASLEKTPEETPTISAEKASPSSKKKIRVVHKVVTKVEGGTSSAIPEGVVLIVGKPKKTASRPRRSSEPVPIAKPEPVSTNEKTSKTKTAKKTSSSKTVTKAKTTAKKTAKVSDVHSHAKKQASPSKTIAKKTTVKAAVKKASPKKEAEANPDFLREASNADRILNANLHNPNYGMERALKEIAEQQNRVRHLSALDQKKLLLSLQDLENWKSKFMEK